MNINVLARYYVWGRRQTQKVRLGPARDEAGANYSGSTSAPYVYNENRLSIVSTLGSSLFFSKFLGCPCDWTKKMWDAGRLIGYTCLMRFQSLFDASLFDICGHERLMSMQNRGGLMQVS